MPSKKIEEEVAVEQEATQETKTYTGLNLYQKINESLNQSIQFSFVCFSILYHSP